MNKIISLLVVFSILLCTCSDSNLPKQTAFLRIEFPEPKYFAFKDLAHHIDFYYNASAVEIKTENSNQLSLTYPKINFSVDLSIQKLNNSQDFDDNFSDFSLLLDTHSKKSNGVLMREYEDLNNRVFSKIYEISGGVASPIQFYITDSTSNFIKGSLNLKFKSNYDSIFPSIQYVKNDIFILVESLNWRSK